MTGNEAGAAGHVCWPASAAEARREVEFALHPLLCSPDNHYLRAHRAGFEDAMLVASELVGHVLHHPENSPDARHHPEGSPDARHHPEDSPDARHHPEDSPDARHHPEDSLDLLPHQAHSPGCFLVCLLHSDEVTITVTDTCEEILPLCPRAPTPGSTGLAGLAWWVINKVADQVVVQALPTGGKTITVAVPLSGP
ncbi:hypothetical protein [Streptomyces sp. CA-146814]|uniref:hypothetical protein n=1 Tax=Streptomyces sp. CA-146814 TaxID=3240053 RepID=UPI003D947483